ncbi:response regulator [Leadbettera azotonutricia]|uniref:Two component transcriptional regulator, LuxR family n=1 Tax=Leadbettera azotonutricia (strain ATCC BAA-888 / DSM 13862 / ZAS-9) TaxID=545695 RepID=F5YB85_LEAAZ|nr:response regulator transcription factor [Leadbettera azotonutricia]AEF81019.1 two component transcriptional regulator, LuxR family [Leadbettera azotonutricia ZAS-9]
MITVVLIDDHPLAVNGIGEWLRSTGRFAIAGTAGSLAQAQALFENLEILPSVVILDIALGPEDGLEVIPMLKTIAKKRKTALPGIVVCSMFEDPFLIQNARNAGAGAYVAKSADINEVTSAIDAVLAGNTYIRAEYQLPVQKWASSGLSRREREIVALIKQRLNNKEIAEKMYISIRTVENHLSHIYVKTNTNSRNELSEL